MTGTGGTQDEPIEARHSYADDDQVAGILVQQEADLAGRDESQIDGLNDSDQTRKDTSYSPASEAETRARQSEPVPATLDADVADKVRVAPGTGGPDDPGEVAVDEGDITLPPVDDEAGKDNR